MLKPYKKAEINFEYQKEIGYDGRNSRVFVALDPQLDAEIVIKQIDKNKLDSASEFFAESKTLYASAHPNVVQIHYACEDDDSIFLAMPYYRKGSIKNLITGRHMTVREIIVAGCQVVSALHNIHSKGLIHFDVKPDNILISERGEALLSDFGQAKQMKGGLAGQDRLYGPMTPPEATRGSEFNRTFDIYQLGLTLYRMCNGNEEFYKQLGKFGPRTSFDRDAFRYDLRNGRFPDRAVFPAHIPSKMRKIIRRCLETDTTNRYNSVLDVANAMAHIDASLDWRLTETNDTKVWAQTNEKGTKLELTLQADGSSTLFQTSDGAMPRRVTKGCKASITRQELQSLLGSYG